MKIELELPDSSALTADEFARLPEVDGVRLELWEGSLVVAAAAQMAWHSRVASRVERLFERQDRVAIREVGVVLGPRDVRNPDVTVFVGDSLDLRRSQFLAADVAVVVEVVSPESRERDRIIKPYRYAQAGIPEFWLVEEHPDGPDDAVVRIYRLTPAVEGHAYTLVYTIDLSVLEIEGPE